MMRETNYFMFITFLFLSLIIFPVKSRSIISFPQLASSSLNLNTNISQDNNNNNNDNVGSCSYTVRFTTSCSSPRYTRDQISLSFGDAYGNQVYAPRIDDPQSRAFEACSVDTYDLRGPCTYDICYLYVYRSGYDGWKLSTVEVYGYHKKAVSFYFNSFIPGDMWFGFDYCYGASAGVQSAASASASA